MDKSFLLDQDIWSGGFYELSLEYNPSGNDKRILTALNTLCRFPDFKGLWNEKEAYFDNTITLPTKIEEDSVTQFNGLLKISNECILGCLITLIRVEEESDWLTISIPMSMLEKFYPVKYDLLEEHNPWKMNLDDLLISLAQRIYVHASFDLGMVGWEVSGYVNHSQITKEHLGKAVTFIIPSILCNKLELESVGTELNDKLRLFR